MTSGMHLTTFALVLLVTLVVSQTCENRGGMQIVCQTESPLSISLIGLDTSPYSGVTTASHRISAREAYTAASHSTLPSAFTLLGLIQRGAGGGGGGGGGEQFAIRSRVEAVSGLSFYKFSTAEVRQLGGDSVYNGTITADQQVVFNFNSTDLICQLYSEVQLLSRDEAVTPDMTLASQIISGALTSCSTTYSIFGRKAATDEAGNLYAVFICSGSLYVSSLVNDGSSTWSGPYAVGVSGADEYAIQGGPDRVAYITYTVTNTLYFLRSIDMGATWSTPALIGPSNFNTVSMASDGEYIYLLTASAIRQVTLSINSNRGQGTWNNVTFSNTDSLFTDVIVDKSNHHVIVAAFSYSGQPYYRLQESSDYGMSFRPLSTSAAGSTYGNDWAGGNGYVYVSISPQNFIIVFPLNDISKWQLVSGVSEGDTQLEARAISADKLGNAYIVSVNGDVIYLDRYKYGNPGSIDIKRSLSVPGAFPAVVALPSNNGALVVYGTSTGQVNAAVETY